MAAISEAECADLGQSVSAMDDETLIDTMLTLLAEVEGAPATWGRTAKARAFTRIVFMEIGLRWLPDDVLVGGYQRLLDESQPALRELEPDGA